MTEKNAALYCRVASADQMALDAQEKILRVFAAENGYGDDLLCYADNGYSGLRLDDRPGFARMAADIEAGSIGTVIIHNHTRIGRDYFLVESWLERLAAQGVKLVAADCPAIAPIPPLNEILLALHHERRKKRGGMPQFMQISSDFVGLRRYFP